MLKRNGFSLMELLVVIAIVGILATVFTFYFPKAQGKARDSKRKTDLAHIKEALELYFNDQGTYPGVLGERLTNGDGSVIYMEEVPGDPRTGWDYDYLPVDSSGFRLYASLENPYDPDVEADGYTGTDCGQPGECNYGICSVNITMTSP